MANFVSTYEDGVKGFNMGLKTGIDKLDRAMNGLQKKTSIGLAAAPKCGKTAFADFCFLISPYLQMQKEGRLDDIEWIYFSYEIDRVSKEFKMASLFMFIDYGIFDFKYKDKTYLMSSDYLSGRLIDYDTDGNHFQVKISEEHSAKLKEVYVNRIVPIFGEYNKRGEMIKRGKIIFFEEPDNPTGMFNYLRSYARQHGEFLYEEYQQLNDNQVMVTRKKVIGYRENNDRKYTVVITDHPRKLLEERGYDMKRRIDKWLEYTTLLRNWCSFTFINIMHSNRGVTNVERLRMHGDKIFPTADDVKDTGNLAEESTILMTLFNPGDEKYNLTRHFGIELADYPNYRSLHITESRNTECPVHIQLNAYNNVNYFEPLIKTM